MSSRRSKRAPNGESVDETPMVKQHQGEHQNERLNNGEEAAADVMSFSSSTFEAVEATTCAAPLLLLPLQPLWSISPTAAAGSLPVSTVLTQVSAPSDALS